MSFSLSRRAGAEAIGTGLLLMSIIGSSAHIADLGSSPTLGLLAHSLCVAATLAMAIAALRPICGAQFNPAVTMAFFIKGEMERREAGLYVIAQLFGGFVGVILAHLMFAEPALWISDLDRGGFSQWISEIVATFTLVSAILLGVRFNPALVAPLVGLFIIGAIWFTSSGAFANPAVTISRILTPTSAGIGLISVVGFIICQLIGAVIATFTVEWLTKEELSQNE